MSVCVPKMALPIITLLCFIFVTTNALSHKTVKTIHDKEPFIKCNADLELAHKINGKCMVSSVSLNLNTYIFKGFISVSSPRVDFKKLTEV